MKRKSFFRAAVSILCAALCALVPAAVHTSPVLAAVPDGAYVSLGSDLNDGERAEVLSLLGVDASELNSGNTVYVTNAEEHAYLDSYIDPSVIGSRALSSCLVKPAAKGHGITVETHNITYCTASMYQNALATAGLSDAEIVVAGPFELSGTAALVGAVKAYGAMTGREIAPELVDLSANELVTTTTLAETIGDPEKVAQLIAAVKQVIAANEFETDEDILRAIDDVAAQLNISLTEADRQLILSLAKKFEGADLDIDTITEQAQNIYEELRSGNLDLSKYGLSQEEQNGIFSLIGKFFSDLFKGVADWFRSLFG